MAKDHMINTFLYVTLGILICIVWPTCAYALHILRKNWDKCYFTKRRRTALSLMLILCSIAVFLSIPLTIMLNILYDSSTTIPPYVFLPAFVPTKCTVFACTMLIMVRIWLFYYDIMYSKEMSSKEWRVLINECISPKEWFTEHKHTFGCHNWCSMRALALSAILVVIYVIIFIKYGGSADFYGIFVYGTLIMISVFIWCKYPKFNDVLGIRDELFKILIVWTSSLIIGYGGFMYNSFVADFAGCIVLGMFVMSMNLWCIVYFTIIDVYNKYKDQPTTLQMPYHQHIQSNSNNYDKVNIKSWKPIISRMDGYELFMNHLQKEFSIENLLFLTEYAQLKSAVIEHHPAEMKQLKEELPWELTLPPSDKLPISCIACRFNNDMANIDSQSESNSNNSYAPFLSACSRIYEKYIKPGYATYEVNISSLKRYAIAQIFEEQMKTTVNEEETVKTVLLRFENAVLSIEALMNDSFSRFKRTEVAKEFWTRFIVDEK